MLIRRNPFAGIRQEKVGDPGWQYVKPEQFHAFIKACPSTRWRGLITLAYCCGLRQGEILNLTWGDIDFEQQRLRVVRKSAIRTTRKHYLQVQQEQVEAARVAVDKVIRDATVLH